MTIPDPPPEIARYLDSLDTRTGPRPILDPRIRVSSAIGTDILHAECLRRGCGWVMRFSTTRLADIIEVCNAHPCKPEPCPSCGWPGVKAEDERLSA